MASFTYAVKYSVTATCRTPLRTGGTESDNSVVLKNAGGIPMIQGTSIAGVMRSYLAGVDPVLAKRLFGDSKAEGSGDMTSLLTVSDAVFTEISDEITQNRPRLRINRATGAGEDGKKFDLTSIKEGSVFGFELLLKTQKNDTVSDNAVVELLSAMNSGVITIGGQRSNGFGEVSIKAKKRSFDMTDANDREAWIDDAECDTPVELGEVSSNAITFELTGKSDSFLIKSGTNQKKEKTENDKGRNITGAMRSADGGFILPGSSLKGVLRSRAEMIADYLGADGVVTELFGDAPDKNTDGTAGNVRVREYRLETAKKQVISRTRIDKFTGGVMFGSLFSEETLSDTVKITVDVLSENPTACGLLFYAMRDMAMGLYAFGGESSVGRGYIKPETACLKVTSGEKTCRFTFGDTTSADGDTKLVLDWLETLERKA